MFILRKAARQGESQTNVILGDYYEFITKSDSKEFELASKAAGRDISTGHPDEETYAFVISKGGTRYDRLYTHNRYYIMTMEGVTFSNLSKSDYLKNQ